MEGATISLSDLVVQNGRSNQGSAALAMGAPQRLAWPHRQPAPARVRDFLTGVYFPPAAGENSTIRATRVAFRGHTAWGDGGAVLAIHGGLAVIESSEITNCTAWGTGGAAAAIFGGSLVVVNTTASGNFAGACGGDLAATEGASLSATGVELVGSASGGYGGSVCAIFASALRLVRAQVRDASSPLDGSCVHSFQAGTASIDSSRFTRRAAGRGAVPTACPS